MQHHWQLMGGTATWQVLQYEFRVYVLQCTFIFIGAAGGECGTQDGQIPQPLQHGRLALHILGRQPRLHSKPVHDGLRSPTVRLGIRWK